jgi:hypothetical protein
VFRGKGEYAHCVERRDDNLRSSLGMERPTVDAIVMMVDLLLI